MILVLCLCWFSLSEIPVGSCATQLVCSSVWIPHLCVCEVVWFLKIIVSLLAEDTQCVSLCPLACALSHSSFVGVHFFYFNFTWFFVSHSLLICTRTNGVCLENCQLQKKCHAPHFVTFWNEEHDFFLQRQFSLLQTSFVRVQIFVSVAFWCKS